jgi:hypothetical protein
LYKFHNKNIYHRINILSVLLWYKQKAFPNFISKLWKNSPFPSNLFKNSFTSKTSTKCRNHTRITKHLFPKWLIINNIQHLIFKIIYSFVWLPSMHFTNSILNTICHIYIYTQVCNLQSVQKLFHCQPQWFSLTFIVRVYACIQFFFTRYLKNKTQFYQIQLYKFRYSNGCFTQLVESWNWQWLS